jgi:catechol 2,3-dioxygenase
MTTTVDVFDMTAAPMRIGRVRLKVRDLETVARFYQAVLGLTAIETGDRSMTLGADGVPLLELAEDAALAPCDPRQAGLFHTAFLLPTRADLARWAAHAAEVRVPLQGASDHIVSEALYLADPEGNGIEVYADQPVSRWRGPEGEIRMATDPLDMQGLLKSAGGIAWAGFPEGGRVGHVHLQVGDTEAADRFYRDVLGLDIAARYPGASFYGSGGYHHQLAGNVWNSRRAGPRPETMAGLDRVEIVVRDPAETARVAARAERAGAPITNDASGITLHDPWGTALALTS